MDLTLSKDLGSREILKVLMVCNDIDGFCGAFKVMTPVFKGFKDSQKLFIMGIVVELGSVETAGQEGNRVNLTIFKIDRKDGSNSIVRSISFHESLFQLIECS